MSFNDDRWIDFTFEEPKAIGFLDLPFSVKEKICRFLKDKADKYEVALVHRKWSTAAQTVLFEKARFDRPDQLRRFIYTIKNNSRIALLVKEIQLTYIDHEEDTVFKTIVKSDKPRHSSLNTPLKDLNILINIIQTCEKIEAVTIYGWNIQPYHIETMASFAKNLSSLYIIGANQNSKGKSSVPHPIPLNIVLPNLTSLRLDGDFELNEAWATTLANKGLRLQHLQISLQNMHRNVLVNLCSPNLKLKELVLTDSRELHDEHVYYVLESFPHLEKLCFEGSKFLTSVSIAMALHLCPGLVDLEIRSSSSEINNGPEVLNKARGYLQSTNLARPTRLVLENMKISDEELMALSPAMVYLNTLGIKSCERLTNKSIVHLFNTYPAAKKFLRHVYLSNCPHITSSLLAEISHIDNISRSIMDVHMESCGDISPRDIYKLCCASVNHNLRHITLTDYRSLEKTVIGTFNEHTGSQSQFSKIVLKKQSIDALAHSNDSELCPLPKNRMLSGSQIILLAKKLDMSTEDLEELLDRVEEEDNQYHNKDYIPSIDSSKRKDRISMLRSSSSHTIEPRPNTPAIWNKEFQNGFLPVEDNDVYTENSEEQTSGSEEQSGYDNDESYDGSYNDNDEQSYHNDDNSYENRQEDEDYNDYYNNEEDIDRESRNDDEGSNNYDDDINNYDEDKEDDDSENAQSTSGKWIDESQLEPTEAIDLGGWGTSNNDWSSPSKSTKTPNKPHQPSFVEIQNHQRQQQQAQKQTNNWSGYRAEDYQNNWVANPLEVNLSAANKKQTISHSRNRPVVIESDGWGVPKKFVAWENVKDQGFAAEVLNEQKNTQYWQKKETGWVTLNNNEQKNEQVATQQSSTQSNVLSEQDFPSLKTANEKVPISFQSLAEKVKNEQQNDGRVSQSRFSRARSSSVVSSDSDVNWTSGNNVQIKISNNNQGYEKQTNGVKKASSKWATATEWAARNDSKKDSWGNAIAPAPSKPEAANNDYEQKGGAAKGWSDYIATTTSTSNRRSYSRSNSRSSTPRPPVLHNVSKENTPRDSPTFEAEQWSEFSATNTHVSPASPPRSSTASPLKNVEQRTTTPSVDNLIDTDNMLVNTNILSSNPVKNEVWDTLNELNSSLSPPKMSVMNDILKPNEVPKVSLPKKVSQEITESFEWTNDDMPTHISSSANTPIMYHFEEPVSGTITEKEKQRLKEAETKDNLVSLDDSPPKSVTRTPNDLLRKNTDIESALIDLVTNNDRTKNENENDNSNNKVNKQSSKEEEDDVFGLGSSQQQTSDDENKKGFSVSLRIQVEEGYQTLVLNQDDNVSEVVKKFCDDLGKPDYYDTLLKSAEEKFQKRKTKYILRRSKKSKK